MLAFLALIGLIFLIMAVLDLFADDSVGVEWIVTIVCSFSSYLPGPAPEEITLRVNRHSRPIIFWFLFVAKLSLGALLVSPFIVDTVDHLVKVLIYR